MKVIRTTYISLRSYVNKLVCEIQNHDELSKAAIKDLSRKIAHARMQFEKLKKQREKIEADLQASIDNAATWEERAVQVHKDDREKALACLSRKKKLEARAEIFKREVEKLNGAEIQIGTTIETLADSLNQAKNQRQILLAKEAKNIASLSTIEENSNELETVFSDWEEKIMGQELNVTPFDSDYDSLEEEFRNQEEQEQLEAELDNLVTASS